MGTRAVIAKPDGEMGWVGRYHHWDGYPSGLGATLAEWHERLGAAELTRILIDEEKVGWSTINDADLTLPPAWEELGGSERSGPLSYSVRGETDELLITHDGDDCGTEWAYVIREDEIEVLERRYGKPGADEGHGTGLFGLGASATDSGGYWSARGVVAPGDVAGMAALD